MIEEIEENSSRTALTTIVVSLLENYVAEKRNEQTVGTKVQRASGNKESLHGSHKSHARALSSKATDQSQV